MSCTVADCDRSTVARGLCQAHYDLQRRASPAPVSLSARSTAAISARKRSHCAWGITPGLGEGNRSTAPRYHAANPAAAWSKAASGNTRPTATATTTGGRTDD